MGASGTNRTSARRNAKIRREAEAAAAAKRCVRRIDGARWTWTPEVEAVFLDTLACTANVTQSAIAAGAENGSVYYHRRKSAAFREAWDHALAHGYALLEARLLERALAADEGKFDAANRLGLALLDRHRAAVEAHRARMAAMGDADTVAAARAALKDKLLDMKCRLAREA